MSDWTRDEVETTEHNRQLQRLIARNRGAIEFKHQNISAVLINFRQPFIPGYLPRQNYQSLLEQVVLEWLSTDPRFFQRLADGPVLTPRVRPAIGIGFRVASLIEKPPDGAVDVEPPEANEPASRFYRTDFVRRDAENRQLGRMGEEWVVEFEQRRLHDDEGRPDLARRIEWIADTRGDGAGYDIASFNTDESPRLIEVKTTGLGKQFPFMVTANEVRVSEKDPTNYHLYRVFEFARGPRLYVVNGSLSECCRLRATQYRAAVSRRAAE